MEKTLFPTHFIIQTKPIGEESGIDNKNRFCQCLVKSLVGFLLLVEIDASFPVFSHVICAWGIHGMISKQLQAKHFHLSVYHGSS